jgi:murein DD-endopeptidase MepM/ murein hydrolase activator NlpD
VIGTYKWWMLVVVVMLGMGISACSEKSSNEVKTAGSPVPPTLEPSITPDEFSTLIAMQSVATEVPTVTPWPTHTSTPSPTPTETFTPTPTSPPASATPYPINTPRSTQVVLEPVTPTEIAMFSETDALMDHYWFTRPFQRDPDNAIRDYLSRSYPFGTTGGDQFATHHGVDIQNPQGTSVLAVGSGWVLYAGPDVETLFGPQPDFYGNVVVIEHDFPAPNGQMLYTLYGHLWKVKVTSGQHVNQGEEIALVGSTGVALGAHLHLEVRLGDPYDYNSVYNPDLWLRSWSDYGVLAGRVFYNDGTLAYNVQITIKPKDGGVERYTFSYADDTVKSDPYYGENYTCGDLPIGEYEVFVRTRGALRFKGTITIVGGQTNWLDINLN